MLDEDLAMLYGVEVRSLLQAVKRNIERFPEDFMFQLTEEEAQSLRSQIVTLKTSGRGAHRKFAPYVFTEQGVAMLSGVLHSPSAVEVTIEIMRTFVRLRRMFPNAELSHKLEAFEKKYDASFQIAFDAIRDLTKKRIGFTSAKSAKTRT